MTDTALQPRIRAAWWSTMRGLGMRIGVVLVLAYVVLFGGGYGGTQVHALRSLSLALVTVVLAAWALVSWRDPAWRPRSALWPAIVIALAALLLSTMLSRFPRLGLEYLAWAVLLIALYLLLVRILTVSSLREQMGAWAALLAFVVGVLYVAVVLKSWLDWWGLLGHIAMPMLRPAYAGLTFGGPTVVAPVMVLLTVAAFGGSRPTSRWRWPVLTTLAVLMLLVVVLTGSRAAWLALGVAAVLTGLALLLAHGSRIGEHLRDRRWRPAAVAGLLVAIPVAMVTAPVILARVNAPGDGGRGGFAAVGLRMFEDSPLLGIGTGTYAVQRAAYTEPGEIDFYVNHAHNVYVQTLAEMGVVGALAGMVVIVAIGLLVVRGLRAGDPVERRWAWAALFGLTYLGCHSLLDFYANMPVVLLAAAIPVAALDATSTRPERVQGRTPGPRDAVRGLAQGVFLGACVLATVVLWRTESIVASHDAAVRSMYAGDWPAATASAASAVEADPDMVAYMVARGIAASALGDWQLAHDSYRTAALVDDLPASWLGLAQAQVALGMPTVDVTTALERALRIGRQQPSVAYAAGWLYDRIGMTRQADDAFADALVSVPSLAADPVWTADPGLAARFPGIIDAAIGRAGQSAWQIALMAGDVEQARSLAVTAELRSALAIETIIDAWTGDPQALTDVRSITEADPGDLVALGWAARISERAGNAVSADRYRRQARYLDDGGFVGHEVRVGGRALQRGTVTGAHTEDYGQMLYRRTLPADLVPPGLPRLIVGSP